MRIAYREIMKQRPRMCDYASMTTRCTREQQMRAIPSLSSNFDAAALESETKPCSSQRRLGSRA